MGEPSVARSKDCDMEYDDSSSRQSGEPLWEHAEGLSLKAATDPFFKSAFSRATSMPGFAAEEDEHQDDQPSLLFGGIGWWFGDGFVVGLVAYGLVYRWSVQCVSPLV
uniref:Uncharacterized protein n=1 Tax=Oryza glumipatula TaxID=40148 RepID=A0A0D9ZZ71_9ORYZ